MGGITKSLGGIGKVGGIGAAVASVTRGMNITPIIQQALGTIAESGDQRAAFNGILLASAANVMKKPNFNLELEINDLFIRLGNLRGMDAPSAGVAGAARGLAGGFGNISSIMAKFDAAAQELAKGAKP